MKIYIRGRLRQKIAKFGKNNKDEHIDGVLGYFMDEINDLFLNHETNACCNCSRGGGNTCGVSAIHSYQ